MLMAQPFNRGWLGFCFISLLSWSLCTGGTCEAQPPGQGKVNADAQIRELLKERHILLEKCLKLRLSQFEIGTVDFSTVAKAMMDALKASLDFAEGPEKRAAVLQEYQKTAEHTVHVVEARFKAGSSVQVDVLQARVMLLEVQIEFLREEQKAKLGK
jgi:hypothetical protein